VIVPAGEGTVHVDAVIAHVRGRLAEGAAVRRPAQQAAAAQSRRQGAQAQLREETDC
jgi:hypothetical protein